jgi:hypothetical protein
LLACWLRGFTFSLPVRFGVRYLEGRLRQVGAAAAARSVPERPSRARLPHIRYFTGLTRLTERSVPLTRLTGRSAADQEMAVALIRLKS